MGSIQQVGLLSFQSLFQVEVNLGAEIDVLGYRSLNCRCVVIAEVSEQS
jgi:hypothetical protein